MLLAFFFGPQQADRHGRYTFRLKPTLGLMDATDISVGANIGAGIFIVTGIVARMAGPAQFVSYCDSAVPPSSPQQVDAITGIIS